MFKKVKEKIQELDGIISCKIIGNGEIDEIHVIADKNRQPKRIVRDIETIVLVNEDKEINHKKISIAQVNSSREEDNSRKIKIKSIYQEHNSSIIHIEVLLNNQVIQKKVEGASGESVNLLVVKGMIEIIEEYTELNRLRVENIFTTGLNNSILLVELALYGNSYTTGEKLLGAVYIDNNLPLAAGKACLKALNRKINGFL